MKTHIAIAITPKQVLKWLLAISVILTCISVIGHALQFVYGRDQFVEFVRLFNLGQEKNIPTWYTSINLFTCGLLLAYITYLQKQEYGHRGKRWVTLAVIFVALSVDAIATIHDNTIEKPLVELLQPSGVLHFPWVILGWLFVFIVAIVYRTFILDLDRYIRYLFILAAVIYLGGALVLEMLSAYLMDYYVNKVLLRGAVATIQEFAEMAGLAIFIYALLIYIPVQFSSSHISGAN